MGERIWKLVSYIFHPILMPALGITIVISIDPLIFTSVEDNQFWVMLLAYSSLTLICTAMLPLFFTWMLFKTGRISSITNPADKDRLQLIAFTELCYILAYYSIHNIPVIGRSLSYFMLGINISMIITLIASMLTRVSLHAVGVGGVLGTVIGLMYCTRAQNFPVAAIAIALVCIVDYSRYKLKAHNAFDIFIGNIIGITCLAVTYMIASGRF